MRNIVSNIFMVFIVILMGAATLAAYAIIGVVGYMCVKLIIAGVTDFDLLGFFYIVVGGVMLCLDAVITIGFTIKNIDDIRSSI